MTESDTTEPASVAESVSIRQLDSPWMKAKEAAAYFRTSVEEIRRGIREFEKTKGRSGLKAIRPKRYAAALLHHDDVLRWKSGEPPTRGTRKYTPA